MTGYIGKTTNKSTEVTGVQAQSEREAMWGQMPGKVVSFDPDTQTATIQPLYKPKLNGVATEMAQLKEVPVRFMRMGGFVLTTPVKEGDYVTLRPSMRNMDNYHEGGDGEAFDKRSFSLSDMEAFLDGGEPASEAISGFNSTNMELRSANGNFKIEMSEDGSFQFKGSQGELFAELIDFANSFQKLCSAVVGIAFKLNSEAALTNDYTAEQTLANQADAENADGFETDISSMRLE